MMNKNPDIPVVCFAAYSGTGKTTLLKKLLPMLEANGIRTGVIKHAHHHFDIDKPGKDSYELRKAGARQMLVTSDKRWALMVENLDAPAPDLEHLLSKLDLDRLDLVLLEGYKHSDRPKIEIHRSELGNRYLFPEDNTVIALVSEKPPGMQHHPFWIDINRPEDVMTFLLEQFFEK